MGAFVQGSWRGGGAAGGGGTCSGSGTISVGNTLVLAIAHEGFAGIIDTVGWLTGDTPHDNLGNTWVHAGGWWYWNRIGGTGQWMEIETWKSTVTNPGVLTKVQWTVQFGNVFGSLWGAVVTEWENWSFSPVQTNVSNGTSITTVITPGQFPLGYKQLIVGVKNGGANFVIPAGWTIGNRYDWPPGSTIYHLYRDDDFSGAQTSSWDSAAPALQLVSWAAPADVEITSFSYVTFPGADDLVGSSVAAAPGDVTSMYWRPEKPAVKV